VTYAGELDADIALTADFDDASPGITGQVTVHGIIDDGTPRDPGWAAVDLNADGTVAATEGGTVTDGHWTADSVHGVTGTAGTDSRPGSIAGRVGLEFPDGAVAGVYHAE